MVNLDGMTTSDLVYFVADKSNDQRLRDYASYCIEARRHRIVGHIANAVVWERKADHIYDALPDALRW